MESNQHVGKILLRWGSGLLSPIVMAGPDPAIHDHDGPEGSGAWMPGTSPGMTD